MRWRASDGLTMHQRSLHTRHTDTHCPRRTDDRSHSHTDAMIHVLAELTIAPGARDAFVQHFRALEPLVRAEVGCLDYRGALECPTGIQAQAPPRADVLLVIEQWRGEAELAAHLDAPHMHEFGARTSGMMIGRTIRIARDISGPFALQESSEQVG